jgi:hypothetical protein
MVARGERFLRRSFGVPAGVLAIFIEKAASEPELKAAIDKIADAVTDFMVGEDLASSWKRGDAIQMNI